MALNALTMFRILASVTDPDKILIGRQKLTYAEVRVGDVRLGDLYFRRVQRRLPQWAEYFSGNVDLEGNSLATASVAAVFLLLRKGRIYALTFGFGRSLLSDDVIERRFGLRVTLNAVEPSQLRSIDHKRLEAISRHTREQLSKAGTLELFGLDTDRDLLGAVTGTPKLPTLGKRLSGSDQLSFVAEVALEGLPDQIDLYADLAEETTYSVNFPWVDNVRQVKDKGLQNQLENALVSEIVSGKSTCWISPPDVIDWDKPVMFAYRSSKKAETFRDLEIADYFDHCGSADEMTALRLSADRVWYSEDGEVGKKSWPIRNCLIAECEYNSAKYVLNDGVWYEIEREFAKLVEADIARITPAVIDLPNYADSGEGAYNKRAAKRDSKKLICLDSKLITYPPRGKIEVCDLYSIERQFVHVKRCSGSGTLSHLFSQGAVSAQLMVSDPGFRAKFRALIPSSHHWGDPSAPLVPDNFEVCYAIVARRKKALDLPFFSKVSLRAAAKNIRQLGMRVSIAEIPS